MNRKADYIPFISGKKVLELALKVYPDAPVMRLPLDQAESFRDLIPSEAPVKLWVDPCADGLDALDVRTPKRSNERATAWLGCMRGLPGHDRIADPAFQARPDQAMVNSFMAAAMGACRTQNAHWITIPQLPMATDSARNKINLAMARGAERWRAQAKPPCKLILAVVLTRPDQTTKGRGPRVQQIVKRYEESEADGIWIVDQSLTDDSGSPKLGDSKLPGLIAMHEEIAEKIPCELKIAGPYWGTNLVLWARGLIDFPAIGVGSGYQYFQPGMPGSRSPTKRIPIPPLRRRARVSPELKAWLEEAVQRTPKGSPAQLAFEQARASYTSAEDPAREAVARFYKSWYDSIAAHPPLGRAIALFQDLSAAFALGRSALKDLPLPAAEGTARRAEAVVEQLMRICL